MKNKSKVALSLFLPCLITGFFVFAKLSSATEQYDDLIVTEIMYDPDDSNTTHSQWIEIYNNGATDITLNKDTIGLVDENTLSISKDGIHYLNCHSIKATTIIKSKNFLILSKNNEAFLNDYSDFNGDIVNATFGLSTKSGTIHLSNDKCATFFTETPYNESWGASDNGMTLEKINFTIDDSPENWQESYDDGGTPGKENSKEPPPIIYSNEIRINELLPKPNAKNIDYKDEFVELYNPSDESENLDKWFLKDRAGKICYLSGKTIKAQDFLVVKNNADEKCALALNDTQGEFLGLYNSKDADPVSSTSYDGSAKEGLSYNFDGSAWRWSKFLTPAAENIFNNVPQAKTSVPEKVFVNTYADFSAQGSDKDNDALKYTWDFGDGHKSYLQIARHKYTATGKYTVTLKVSDDSEDNIKSFQVEVENFPKLDIKIVSLSPNPVGADTNVEFLNIKNNTKKKINLKNWSVASGTKTLANHPITEDFFIKAGRIAKLTYAASKFTLPNTKGKIELRYPNGNVASHISYGDKKKNIAEGATYEKTKSGWQWNIPVVAIAKTKPISVPIVVSEIPAPVLPQENIPAQLAPTPIIEEKDFGQSSPSPEWQNKKKTRFSLLNYGLGIKVAQAFSTEIPQLQPDYSSKNFPAQKHWFITLLENLNTKINSFLNKLTAIL